MKIRMARKTLAIVTAAACLMTGCSGHQEPSAAPAVAKNMFPNWPSDFNGFRFRWTAQPGTDLLTGPAIPVRAYLESYRIGSMTKSSPNTYPGFQRALPDLLDPRVGSTEEWLNLPMELRWIIPSSNRNLNYVEGPFFGNHYFHIMELSPLTDGYLAYVCEGKYNVFAPAIRQPEKYASVLGSPSGKLDVAKLEYSVTLWRIELKNGDGATVGMQPQTGRNPAPVGDVFGHWKITGASQGGYWGQVGKPTHTPQDPDYVHMEQQCRDVMPHNTAQRAQILMSVLDTPPQAEPAVPGWPDSTV